MNKLSRVVEGVIIDNGICFIFYKLIEIEVSIDDWFCDDDWDCDGYSDYDLDCNCYDCDCDYCKRCYLDYFNFDNIYEWIDGNDFNEFYNGGLFYFEGFNYNCKFLNNSAVFIVFLN